MYECPFCTEAEGRLYAEGFYAGDRRLLESGHFVVFPSLGQIVEGHLLIATREHYVGMGALRGKAYAELEEQQERVRDMLSRRYAAPLFFEHGPDGDGRMGGCSIGHAHMHAVPVDVDLFVELSSTFPYRRIDELPELAKHYQAGQPYIFLEEQAGGRYIFDVSDDLPAQYVRKRVTLLLGETQDWDWRSAPALEKLARTLEKLR